jgi:dihydropteroate synthase
MGVLNVTPDSFSDGGKYLDVARATARANEMSQEGARLIDIGGASSRPKGTIYGTGAELVSLEEELRRVVPVVVEVVKSQPHVWISVDTFRSEVAHAALEAGAHMINDITSLRFDPKLAGVCATFNAPLILMHSVGLPGDMPHVINSTGITNDMAPGADKPSTSHDASELDIVEVVFRDLKHAAETAQRSGCTQLILDPGFGFGKNVNDNLRLISDLNHFQSLGWPLMIGVSRKSTIGEILSENGDIPPPNQRLLGGLGVTAVGIASGASLVRTHDVYETKQFLGALDATRRTSKL